MSDISSSEKRLIAALDRIDRSLSASPPAAAADDGALQAAQAEVARLTAALATLTAEREAEVSAISELIGQIEGTLDEPTAPPAAGAGSFAGVYGTPEDDDQTPEDDREEDR